MTRVTSGKESLYRPHQRFFITALGRLILTLQVKKLRDEVRCPGPRSYEARNRNRNRNSYRSKGLALLPCSELFAR